MSESEADEMIRAVHAMLALLDEGYVLVDEELRGLVRERARDRSGDASLNPTQRGIWLALGVHLLGERG